MPAEPAFVESAPPTEVTRLLARARAGDAQAMDAAYSAVYHELKRAARLQLRRMHDNFETTALVHEAYLKLGGAQLVAQDRNHLLALSARAMRQVLVDDARARKADKRGGGQDALTLGAVADAGEAAAVEVLKLDELLQSLHRLDERNAADDALEVMAACMRQRESALLYLQHGQYVWPVTLFPLQMLYHSPREMAPTTVERLDDLKLINIEPPGVRPPGHWMYERVGQAAHYRPLLPLLWLVALRGPRRGLLSEIGGTAA